MNNYIPLLMIPLGALLYLAISRLSDLSILNRGVNLHFDGTKDTDTVDVGRQLIQLVLRGVVHANNRTLAVKHMPIKLAELTSSLSREVGIELQDLGEILAGLSSDFLDSVALRNGFICMSNKPYRDLCAMDLYENAMSEWSLRIKEKISIERFIAMSGALCYRDMGLRELYKIVRKVHAKICTCSTEETRSLQCSESLYCSGNSLLLFLRLNNIVEVVEC